MSDTVNNMNIIFWISISFNISIIWCLIGLVKGMSRKHEPYHKTKWEKLKYKSKEILEGGPIVLLWWIYIFFIARRVKNK